MNINFKEIFTPGKVLNQTYNKRQEVELESRLLKVLEIGGKIAVLTGQSKIGKPKGLQSPFIKRKAKFRQSAIG